MEGKKKIMFLYFSTEIRKREGERDKNRKTERER
jgi:hypothetical protein